MRTSFIMFLAGVKEILCSRKSHMRVHIASMIPSLPNQGKLDVMTTIRLVNRYAVELLQPWMANMESKNEH